MINFGAHIKQKWTARTKKKENVLLCKCICMYSYQFCYYYVFSSHFFSLSSSSIYEHILWTVCGQHSVVQLRVFWSGFKRTWHTHIFDLLPLMQWRCLACNKSISRWRFPICKFIYSCQSDRIYQFRVKFDSVCATSITFASAIRVFFWSCSCCSRRHLFWIRYKQWHDDELEERRAREREKKKSLYFQGSFAYYVNLTVAK